MITLKEAFKLCKIRDDEIVWLCDSEDYKDFAVPHTGKNVRDRFDMKKTVVKRILKKFFFGEFDGLIFVIGKRGCLHEKPDADAR